MRFTKELAYKYGAGKAVSIAVVVAAIVVVVEVVRAEKSGVGSC
jgi:hypothetical protein